MLSASVLFLSSTAAPKGLRLSCGLRLRLCICSSHVLAIIIDCRPCRQHSAAAGGSLSESSPSGHRLVSRLAPDEASASLQLGTAARRSIALPLVYARLRISLPNTNLSALTCAALAAPFVGTTSSEISAYRICCRVRCWFTFGTSKHASTPRVLCPPQGWQWQQQLAQQRLASTPAPTPAPQYVVGGGGGGGGAFGGDPGAGMAPQAQQSAPQHQQQLQPAPLHGLPPVRTRPAPDCLTSLPEGAWYVFLHHPCPFGPNLSKEQKGPPLLVRAKACSTSGHRGRVRC